MIIPFLQSLYAEESYFPSDLEEMKKLLADLELFSLSAHAFHLLKITNKLPLLPEFAQKALADKANRILFHSLLLKHEIEQLAMTFEKAKIDVILMKGIPLAERYFGHFSARQTGDIDLLVHPYAIEKAIECVIEAGFDMKYELELYHITFFKKHGDQTLRLELHRSIGFENTAEIDPSRLWGNSIKYKEYNHIKEFNPEDTFYTICIHGVKDFMLYKHIIDIVHFLVYHPHLIDLASVLKLAEKEKTKQRVLTALTIAYQLLPELHRQHPFINRKKLVYWNDSLIRQYINDRESSRNYLFVLVFPLLQMDNWKHRFVHVRNLLIPSRHIVEWITGLPKNTSLLKLYIQLYKIRWNNITMKGKKEKGAAHV
jgi:hypothetical protein